MTLTAAASEPPSPPLLLRALGILEARLVEAVEREERVDFERQHAARVTQIISQVAIAGLLLLTPAIFYLIFSLIISMGVITDRMGLMSDQVSGMRGDFDDVTRRMVAIDQSMSQITVNVAYLRNMGRRLRQMRDDFGLMAGAMDGLTPNMAQIDRTLAGMDFDLAQMNWAFGRLNLSVFTMGRDVNTMSTPMRMMPFFGN